VNAIPNTVAQLEPSLYGGASWNANIVPLWNTYVGSLSNYTIKVGVVGVGTVSITGTAATFSTSQTGLAGRTVQAANQVFTVASGSGTSWTMNQSASPAVSNATFLRSEVAPSSGQTVSAACGWGGQAPCALTISSLSGGTGHLYVGWYARYSSGYRVESNDGLRLSGMKMLYVHTDSALNVGIDPAAIVGFGGDGVPNDLRVCWVNQFADYTNGDSSFFNVPPNATDLGTNHNNGAAHLFEYLITPNTEGNADGVVSAYQNGTLLSTVTGLRVFCQHVTSASMRWTRVTIENYYGGGWVECPQLQYQYIGPIRVATK
jgi:hypothetical protein